MAIPERPFSLLDRESPYKVYAPASTHGYSLIEREDKGPTLEELDKVRRALAAEIKREEWPVEYGVEDRFLENPLGLYLYQCRRYPPRLYPEQIVMAYEARNRGLSLADLAADPSFWSCRTQAERRKLYNAFRETGDIEEFITVCNLPLVVFWAKKFPRLVPLADLVQEGNCGLMVAVRKFDHTKGFTFSTYASWWIRQAIRRGLNDRARTIRIPVHALEAVFKARRAVSIFEQRRGRYPTYGELHLLLREGLGLTGGKTKLVIDVICGRRETKSLDMPVGENDDATLGDFIAGEVDGTETIALRLVADENVRRRAKQVLPPRLWEVIKLRFGLDGTPQTLEEIKQLFGGISRERVRQLEGRALRMLRREWNPEEQAEQTGEPLARAVLLPGDNDLAPHEIFSVEAVTRLTLADMGEWGESAMAHAINMPEVWGRLSAEEKSLLRPYFQENIDRELLKKRLALIFGLSVPEMELMIVESFNHMISLLKIELRSPSRSLPVASGGVGVNGDEEVGPKFSPSDIYLLAQVLCGQDPEHVAQIIKRIESSDFVISMTEGVKAGLKEKLRLYLQDKKGVYIANVEQKDVLTLLTLIAWVETEEDIEKLLKAVFNRSLV